MAAKRDYYEVLDVPRDVDDVALKKAYHKAALRWHPDRNPGDPDAEARFKEAAEAFEVLGDPQRRAIYDRLGHEGLQGGGPGAQGFTSADEVFSQFADLFGDLLGNGRRGGSRGGPRRGSDLEVALRLSFMQAVEGGEHTIEVPRQVRCSTCDGTGARVGSEPSTCGTCGGRGEVIQQQMFVRVRTACPTCRGRGKVVRDPCGACAGRGRERMSEKLAVTVPPGVDTGMQLRLAAKGSDGDVGAPSGDLYVTLHVEEHEYFRRDGFDVYLTLPVSYAQMCLGAEVEVPTVYGPERLQVPRGTPSGKVFTLRGKGIVHVNQGDRRGDQHVQVVVAVPKEFTPREEELLRELARIHDAKVKDKGFWRDLVDRLTS